MVSGSLSLPAQGCFSPVPHGTRPLSVTQESLALEGGPPSFTPDFASRALLRNSTGPALFHYRAVTVSGAPFQGTSARFVHCVCGSYNPGPTRRPVWARPVSLAATQGISFDFSSCRYLDVSVPGVRFPCGMTRLASCRVSPFGHLGITACVQLPQAYRSLPRPSSPLCTQASPTCFRSLDPFFVKQSTRDLLCTSETIHCPSLCELCH